MAKMFYTLEEAAEKLGKSEDEVREMAKSGRVQEFRDRDKLMFKVEQIDLLAGDDTSDEDSGGGDEMIPLSQDDEEEGGVSLEESSGGLDLSDLDSDEGEKKQEEEPGASGTEFPLEESGTGAGFALEESSSGSGSGSGSGGGSAAGSDPGHRTGVSVFDADELEEADPAAVTQVQEQSLDDADFQLDSVGSGSGLLDLTRESDDTSLGAEFLDEIYPGEEGGGGEEGAEGAESPSTGLFEPSGAEEADLGGAGPAVAAAPPERIDGPGSGLAAGLSFGAVLALALGMAVVITSMMGVTTGSITEMVAGQFWIVIGGIAGVTVLGGLIGFVLGNRGG